MPTTRRSFLAGTTALTLAEHPLLRAAAAKNRHLLLVGTETSGKSTSKGIYLYHFDPTTGELTEPILAAESTAPTFLALSPNQRLLFAANENAPGGTLTSGGFATSYAFNSAKRSLTQINQVAAAGADPVYLSTDHTGHCVFVANYGSGSIASYQVDANGRLSDPVSQFTYPSPPDQPNKRSHAHRVTVSPDNRFLLVNDLGLDRIHIYSLDSATARLTPHGEWRAVSNDGPRALRFHPNGRIAYCVNETQPTVHTLVWNAQEGTLSKLQTLQLAPTPNDCHPGDIVLDRTAQHAYVSTRRDNTVAQFAVDRDGMLTQTGKLPSNGTRPRDLTLDPTNNWLLVANQDSNNIAIFRRNPKTGVLTPATTPSTNLDQPMCLLFPDRSSIV